MITAVQVTKPRGTVVSDPPVLADTLSFLQVEVSVARAVWKALPRLFVHQGAVVSFPPFLADTAAVYAETMVGAGGVRAVNWKDDTFGVKIFQYHAWK